ncbi:diphosphomevalonate/mevalonate 3,5-bisphosphate decarboxylase family protein [Thermoplasma acidophilum]|uniref:diphosphomevalonate/mevalonate 3,5-bisphosphate decarboxylase family protein n=1 Tax=Thermoplasma acidophilum TaxID=2303 RepID=UPI0006915D05|nr:diphosphomevalonate/mevalonate 3,5-bisphosphate decarboxylase family protein [Thermoplasma acidophilum]MCY0851236.1 diphosphomevalonate/mevalonate 3,5-bisphosphate decarboxylase family protein [Thermoplasma acidophilum]
MQPFDMEKLLRDRGIYRRPGMHAIRPAYRKIAFGAGYSEIGIIKSLGYYDSTFNILNFPCVSMAADFSRAYAALVLTENIGEDTFILNGRQDEQTMIMARRVVQLLRSIYSIRGSFHVYIKVDNKQGGGCGHWESAAVAAAFARSVARSVFDESAIEDGPFLSKMARLVSGSGAASTTGPLSVLISWPGYAHDTSFALGLPMPDTGIALCAVPIAADFHRSNIHEVALRSPFYREWATYTRHALLDLLNSEFDADTIIRTATNSSLMMHATLMSSRSILWTEKTIDVVSRILEMRSGGRAVGFSIDAGPSVVLMARNAAELDEARRSIDAECVDGSITSGEPSIPPEFLRMAREALDRYT